jgi:hypothetical protein
MDPVYVTIEEFAADRYTQRPTWSHGAHVYTDTAVRLSIRL